MSCLVPLAALLALMALPATAAETHRSVNRLDVTVTQADPFRITVFGPTEMWARDYWCAAGDIAFRKLGLPMSARLQVTRSYVPEDQSVVFGAGGARPGGAVILGNTVRSEGASLGVGQARSYCGDRFLRNSR